MRGLSLHEPWATAMAYGLKKYETRSWGTDFRGLLVICSAKRKMDNVALAIWGKYVQPHVKGLYVPHYGHALCVVELIECLPVEAIYVQPEEKRLGNYAPGRWAWITKGEQRLDPAVPLRGRQGLFYLSAEETEAIRKSC